MRSLIFLMALCVMAVCVNAKVKDMDGCALVQCPPSIKGVHNIIPNPHGQCSFCCCVSGSPQVAHCPFGKEYDHGSRDCVRSSQC